MTFAFLFFDSVGGGEWLVLLAVVLIVVGPKNLPAAARKVGQVLSQLRRAADEFKRQIMTMDQEMTAAVEGVKKDYIDMANDVSTSVTDTVESASADPGADETGPSGDGNEDRAYDYYGESGYNDETGEAYSDYTGDDSGPVLATHGAEETAAASAEAPVDASVAAVPEAAVGNSAPAAAEGEA